MSQKLISIGKAADILGVHVDTLREWDTDGKLTPVKTIGNHRRYRLEDIESLCGDKPKVKKSDLVRVATANSANYSAIFPGNDTILLCLPVETLRSWKNKSVLELIQSLDGDVANEILNEK